MEKHRLFKSKLKLSGALMLFLFCAASAFAQTITGTVSDNGGPLPGTSIVEKGTSNGTQTDFDGNFTIEVTNQNAVLIISYLGFNTQEINLNGQTTLKVRMEEDAQGLDEVVVVGYGKKKKVNLTGAISVIGKEALASRPVANAQQALQGASPNLQITSSDASGEPGAEMDMNIRGLTSLEGNSSPFVLVDGIPMGINDIDPSDIESISVLKDVAASSIYGARAAYGVILITTKSGKNQTGVNVSYSTNFAMTSLLNLPQNADALSFAHAMNQARANIGSNPYYDEGALDRIAQNMASPGSATEVSPTTDGSRWNLGTEGLNSSAATDWQSILFRKSGSRTKHNINVSGGNDDMSFYLSGGLYEETGLLKQGDDSFNRYNISANISAKLTPWMNLSLLTKYKFEEEEYPTHATLGRSFVMLLSTRIKPTKPAFYPGTEVWTGRIEEQITQRSFGTDRQIVLSPRLTLEPIKNWVTNIDVNYRTNDNSIQTVFPTTSSAVPDGSGGSIITSSNQANTRYWSELYTNTYISPNIYSNYTKSFGKHNFGVLAGYQQETYDYSNLLVQSNYLLTDAIPSISTAVGEITNNFDSNAEEQEKGHWSTQGFFGRFNYNFDEKYLLEMNIRRDGSSRFDPDNRWGTFPSASAGWVVSKEKFFPLKDQVDFFKFRGSYGSIGNQNVDNYLYDPTLPINQSNYLFGGEQLWTVGTPDLSSVDLTWETVTTLDFGLDLRALNNRLGFTFDWYESKTTNLVGPGQIVPVILGANEGKTNSGEVTTKGWELELSWQNSSDNFSYGFKGVLSDYKNTVTKYNNPTKLLPTDGFANEIYYEGMELGEIWGLETDGLFQSEEEVTNWNNDQSFIYSGAYFPGDVKYVDQNGDNIIDIGDNTKENSGDRKIIGNSTPRYQFGFSANASWKGFDFSFLVQGVGKRDLDLRGLGTFRGPANGPLHANVYTEHLDYWRDDTSPLGANPDAYFANSYSQFIGQNNKNYRFPTTRYLQNGAYVRLKNMQIGYTLPSGTIKKTKIPQIRIYASGENLLTFTDLIIYDPESFNGRNSRIGDQYPLSQVFSLGLNINF